MVMVVGGHTISDTEEMAAYLVTQVFRPAGAQEGTGLPARLPAPPDWAAKLAAVSNDDELKDAILEATSNTPGPDGVP
jgi:hypothetical protein